MPERKAEMLEFARTAGCETTALSPISGDASNRRYFRLQKGGVPVVLMDAPGEKGEDVRPFVRIASWLTGIGLSAPEILAVDEACGFLLLEDLGDDLFARLLANGAPDAPLYATAIDVLLHLRRQTPPSLETYSSERMAEMAALSVVWYRSGALNTDTSEDAKEFETAMARYFAELDRVPSVLIQRDYHAENLIWLPERTDLRRVGLLDFQDAMLGHPGYDLVSILQDARRDVSAETQTAMLQRFITKGDFSPDFTRDYHLLGLQRNLRILGVFARLSLRDGRAHYVDLIPRVWGHVLHNLTALEDAELTHLVTNMLPSPNAAILEDLKAQ